MAENMQLFLHVGGIHSQLKINFGNIDMTLEFVSTFLWRAPPLEMRAERREFFSGRK